MNRDLSVSRVSVSERCEKELGYKRSRYARLLQIVGDADAEAPGGFSRSIAEAASTVNRNTFIKCITTHAIHCSKLVIRFQYRVRYGV